MNDADVFRNRWFENATQDATITVRMDRLNAVLREASSVAFWCSEGESDARKQVEELTKQNTALRARVDELEKENDRLCRARKARK